MHQPDGNEIMYRVKTRDGGEHQLSLDFEDYARMMNDPDMQVLEELSAVERPIEEAGEGT